MMVEKANVSIQGAKILVIKCTAIIKNKKPMDNNRDFKGIWIPRNVWLSKELTLQEKIMYVEINSLDGEDGCYASNKYFADFFDISERRVTEIIASLIDKKYIYMAAFTGKQRILKCTDECEREDHKAEKQPSRKVLGSLEGKFQAPDYNNIENNTVSKDTVAVQLEPKAEQPTLLPDNSSLKASDSQTSYRSSHVNAPRRLKFSTKPPFANNPVKYGNGQVDAVLQAFKEATGHAPTDEKPRQVAWNTYQLIEGFLKAHPKLRTDYGVDYVKFLSGYVKFLKKPNNQGWSSMMHHLKAFKLKLPLYYAALEKYVSDQDRIKRQFEEEKKRQEEIEKTPVNTHALEALQQFRHGFLNKPA